jgi:hypothetical protein
VVFGGNADDVLATLDFRCAFRCAFAEGCKPLQCEPKQTLVVDERNKLLGKALAAQWPEPGARAATQDNGGNSHVTDL